MSSSKFKSIITIAALSLAICAVASCGTSSSDGESGTSGASGNCKHVEVIDAAVAPTCEKDGLTEGKHCSVCGEILTAQKSVSATGSHTYSNGECSVCGKLQATSDEYFTFTEQQDGTFGIVAKNVNNLPDTVVIPDSYNGKAVSYVGFEAFKEAKGIKRVIIPDSVKSVGTDAFRNCESLESLTIGRGVKTFGWHAFVKCVNLTELYYNATESEDMYNNHNLFFDSGKEGVGIKVVIGANVKHIPEYLFSTTSTPMHYYACARVSSVEFENGSVCETIGERAFEGCVDLKKAIIPDSVKSIGVCAFINCRKLAELTIGNGVTVIESSAFDGCEALTSVIIPDSVKTVEDSAFRGCKGVGELTIGSGVTSIESAAFSGFESLTKIYYNAIECADLKNDNRVFYKAGLSGNGFELIVGAKVKKLPEKLFYPYISFKDGNPKLTIVTFEKGSACESIGEYAFKVCTGITDIYYPDSAEKWSGVSVGKGNDPLQSAKMHYNGEGR